LEFKIGERVDYSHQSYYLKLLFYNYKDTDVKFLGLDIDDFDEIVKTLKDVSTST